jgi:DNA-binding IclR family transcriptional regulator
VNITSDTREGARDDRIQVLAKAAALLDLLATGEHLAAAELAERLGEPRSSVYRLLASLQSLGFVAPADRRGGYRIGMKLFRLGTSAVRDLDLREAALGPMKELRDKTDATVFLAIRTGGEALCIERANGRWILNNILQVGTTVPLHIGAVGKVLLAYETDAFQSQYLEQGPLRPFTDDSIVQPKRLKQILAEVREAGVSISDEDALVGMAGVGAPIHDHTGRVCAAVSFSGPKPAVLLDKREGSMRLVKQTADEISRSLGYDVEPAG